MKYYIIKGKIKRLAGKTGTTHFNQMQAKILKSSISFFFFFKAMLTMNPKPWNILISVKLFFPLENLI